MQFKEVMKKVISILFLTLNLFALVRCRSGTGDSNLISHNSKRLTENLISVKYIYSLGIHKEVFWSTNSTSSPTSHCKTDFYLNFLAELSESEEQDGLLSPNQFHTADNPYHRLILTYSSGEEKTFNLHIESSYQTELILSNTENIIDVFENATEPGACL